MWAAQNRRGPEVRAVVQRVTSARVEVAGETVGAIRAGLVVLLAVTHSDSTAESERLAAKVASLRVFEDDSGKMNLDVAAAGGQVLCISQFTLYGDVRKGNRPSFDAAARPAQAEELYEAFCAAVRARGLACETGRFGAEMAVHLVNDGPVTVIIDTEELSRPRRA